MANSISKYEYDERLDGQTMYPSVSQPTIQVGGDVGMEFWRRYLEGADAPQFPALASATQQPQANKKLAFAVEGLEWPPGDITASTLVRTAWAMLVGAYTNSNDVVFGATVTGSHTAGCPTTEIVPVRVIIEHEMPLEQLLWKVHTHAVEATRFEQIGLLQIRSVSEEAEQACRFQSLLVVQQAGREARQRADSLIMDTADGSCRKEDFARSEAVDTYAMILECDVQSNGLGLRINFDSCMVGAKQIARMVQQLEHLLRQLCTAEHAQTRLIDLEKASGQDLCDIWRWNATAPGRALEACLVHDLFAQAVQRQPDAPAVCAWDGKLTYSELDDLSTRLAHELIMLGAVGPGVIVPLCFEKSMWVPVAVLGVMKAGGAFVAIDTNLPENRLRALMEQVRGPVIVSSVSKEDLASLLTEHTAAVVLPEKLLKQPAPIAPTATPEAAVPALSEVKPSNMLYIVFTSGSTGTPKGLITTHANFSAAARLQQQVLGITANSRVYDFASYAFDLSWANALHSLTAGACLCIPSEEDRKNDIAGSMQRLQANYTILTPSVLRALNPDEVPNIQCLGVGGEEVMESDVAPWRMADRRVFNVYGPAECTMFSCVSDVSVSGMGSNHIGKGIGMTTWIVESPPIDEARRGVSRLASVGALGELWLEGPLVGGGYLNDLEKTATVFLEDPPWLTQGAPGQVGRRGRLYRSGDLVRYCPDGSGNLEFVGRKDRQVKIRGQRVELGEVEHHVRHMLLPGGIASTEVQVAAEVVRQQSNDRAMLVAFVVPGGAAAMTEQELQDKVSYITNGLDEKLAATLPLYMVPAKYIAIAGFPMTATDKIDRQQLRQLGASLELGDQINTFSSDREDVVTPSNTTERVLHDVWAQVLSLTAASISVEAAFTRLGGDSISAMQVVSRCRAQGVRVTVADILSLQTIRQIARQSRAMRAADHTDVSDRAEEGAVHFGRGWTFSPMHKMFFELGLTLGATGLGMADVRDIMPCTPLQNGILLSRKRGTASYANRWIWKCEDLNETGATTVSAERLRRAWQRVIARHSVFSTIFADQLESGRFVQVVLQPVKPQIRLIGSVSLAPERTLETLAVPSFAVQEPEYLVTICQGQNGQIACRLDMSHALIDAASLAVLSRDLAKAYSSEEELSAAPQFRAAVEYIERTRQSGRLQYWATFLRAAEPCNVPTQQRTTSEGEAPTLDDAMFVLPIQTTRKTEIYDACRRDGITRSIFLQVAWAITLSRLTGASRPCFGYVASGRDMPVEAVDEIVGPLISMLVSLVDLNQDLRGAILATRKHSIEHFNYQHTSLAEIHHELGLGAALLFNTGVTVHESWAVVEGLQLHEVSGEDPHEFDVVLGATLDGPRTEIKLGFRRSRISTANAHEYRQVLEAVIDYMLSQSRAGGDVPAVDLRRDLFYHHVGVDEEAAALYWKWELDGSKAVQFPSLPSPAFDPHPDSTTTHTIEGLLRLDDGDFTPTTTVRAAWAVLQAQHTNASEATFGTIVTGRQAPIDGVERMVDPAIAIVPIYVAIDTEATVAQLLQRVQEQAVEMTSFEQTGLQRIRRVGETAELCCRFQTLLVIQEACNIGDGMAQCREESCSTGFDIYDTYALVVICRLQKGSIQVQIRHDSRVVSSNQARRIVSQFEHVLRQIVLLAGTHTNVREVGAVSAADLQEIWTWNKDVPARVEECVHDLIAVTMRRKPEVLAVDAWDGQLTYRQLDDLSTQLAHQLTIFGVGPEVIVPLCFEKSVWMPVAMLGVMKAGGASVALDITQPVARLRSIVRQVRPVAIVSSVKNADLARSLYIGEVVVAVDKDHLDQLASTQPNKPSQSIPSVQPTNSLYLVFTSGSTGTPKGVVITHSNFCSALKYQAAVIGVNSSSRVLDLAPYAFDLAWYTALHTLHAGGVLCIPRVQQSPAEAITLLRPNFMTTTPTVAGIVSNEGLDSLDTIELVGEIGNATLLAKLQDGRRKCRNGYGPAECTPASCFSQNMRTASHIGYGAGVRTWIVGAASAGHLAPVGGVGELWLEGPLVGKGYFEDPARTAAAFVDDPEWLLRGSGGVHGRRGRLYRTGDLVRYEDDGSLTFIGRKDAQVKIRGQRVELGEVEHHVRHLLGESEDSEGSPGVQVVAEVVMPSNGDRPTLAVFVAPVGGVSMTEEQLSVVVAELTKGVGDHLAQVVPAYMVPSAYIPVASVPMTATGKTDRRRLRERGAGFTLEQLAQLGRREDTGKQRRQPRTVAERRLRRMWASLLDLEEEKIGIDDSFLRIGGNSILALQLVAAAREQGFSLSMPDVFQRPRLSDLAPTMIATSDGKSEDAIAPFVMLPGTDPIDFLGHHILPQLPHDCGVVHDVYPVSFTQILYLGDPATGVPRMLKYFFLDFSPNLDARRLEESCQALVRHFDVLRTIFVSAAGSFYQVVLEALKIPIEVQDIEGDIESATHETWKGDQQNHPPRLGRSFVRFVILRRQGVGIRLVFRISHSQYDGLSFAHLIPALGALYHGQHLPQTPPFARYIYHATHNDREAAYGYWRSVLRGSSMTAVTPPVDSTRERSSDPSVIITRKKVVPFPHVVGSEDVTSATIFTAACALMLAKVTGSRDIVFGRVVSGRHSLPISCQGVIGPCVNCVPMRLQVDPDDSSSRLLTRARDQYIESLPYEAVGFHEIMAHCADWTPAIDDFWCATHFGDVGQPASTEIAGCLAVLSNYNPRPQNTLTNQVEVQAILHGNELHLQIDAWSHACDEPIVDRMLNELSAAIAGFC